MNMGSCRFVIMNVVVFLLIHHWGGHNAQPGKQVLGTDGIFPVGLLFGGGNTVSDGDCKAAGCQMCRPFHFGSAPCAS